MSVNGALRSAIRDAITGLTQREVSDRTGISPSYVHALARGRVPSREILERFAAGLGLAQADRERLLYLAGYAGEMRVEGVKLTPVGLHQLQLIERLSPEQRTVMERLLEEPAYLDNVGRLMTGRVRGAVGSGSRPAVLAA